MKHGALSTHLSLHAACLGNSLSVSFSLQFIEFRGYYFQVSNFLIAFFTYAVHLVRVLELWCFYLPAPCKSTTSQFELERRSLLVTPLFSGKPVFAVGLYESYKTCSNFSK